MELADRMKLYETIGAGQRLIPNLRVCIRLDGKVFHSWTRGLKRPYDDRVHTLFDATTTFLVQASDAVIGHTQSDERKISVVLTAKHQFRALCRSAARLWSGIRPTLSTGRHEKISKFA
jgi:tRNA(His) 5'-end guanylyltransferase